jgi:hypothetical protein
MINAILICLSILMITGCDSQPTQQQSAAAVVPETLPLTSSTPVPAPDITGGLAVVVHEANNFNATEAALLEQARVLLEKVVNSEAFKQQVLHFTYLGQETYVQNNGLTNQQIYDDIMAGAEQLPTPTAANQIMDLYTELYYKPGNVIGYTDPSVHTIFMNSYFFDSAAASAIAGNMMHEWLHKLGFDHDFASTARRPSSVPYAIGYIAEDLAATY